MNRALGIGVAIGLCGVFLSFLMGGYAMADDCASAVCCGGIMGKWAVPLCGLGLLLLGAALGASAQDADLPTDAPDDSVMAPPNEIKQMHDWARAAFLGGEATHPLLGTALPCSFQYGGKPSSEAMKTWKQSADLKTDKDCDRHVVTWADPATGLHVQAVVTVWKRYPAAEWVLYFENTGQQDTPILEGIQAIDVGLRTDNAGQPLVLHQLNGDDCTERSFLPTQTSLRAGRSLTMAPSGGRSSNTSAFPFFNIEYGDGGMIAAIGWSGQWAATLARDGAGPARLRAGMEKTHLLLHPGERIRSPRILLFPWKGDRLTAHQRFRRLLMFHYVPKHNGPPLPLPFASQCFDRYYRKRAEWATEAGQIAAAKSSREIGCDYLWFDAGWFPLGFPHGVGNWRFDPAQLPHGLKPISDACHQGGLKFIVWFEPERVAKGTDIAREHPEFVFGGEQGGLFKLSDPAARRWMTDLLSKRISEFGIDVYRNDFNIDPLAFWRRNDAPDREGMTEIRYVEGHYAMWDELIARHPGLWIDNCASGGRRIDLETIMRSVPLWHSDTCCFPGHADWNQTHAQGLCLYVPLFTSSAWTPDAYDARAGATGGLICQFDYLDDAFPVDQAKAAVAEAKENRKYWYGDFYPISFPSLAPDTWAAYQLHRADLNAGLLLAFRRKASPYPSMVVALRGIVPEATYAVEFIDDARQVRRETMSGRRLSEEQELRLAKGASMVLRYRMVQ